MKVRFLLLTLFFIILFGSCRKKDQKYDGTYVGIDRIIHSDSNGVYFDTSYFQIVTVDYKVKKYTIKRLFNNPENYTYTDPHNAFKENGSSGFGDCVDDAQGNSNCGASWRYFYATDSLRIQDGGSTNDKVEQLTFTGKKQ